MRMRALNILIAGICFATAILGLLAMYTVHAPGMAIVTMWIAAFCGLVMFVRVIIGAIASAKWQKEYEVSESDSELMEFAVAVKSDPAVKDRILSWFRTYEGRTFFGKQARLANVADLVDGEGRKDGYWLLMVGTRQGYETAVKETSEYATVLDFWPVPEEGWDAMFRNDDELDESNHEPDTIDQRANELLDKVNEALAEMEENKNANQSESEGMSGEGA